MKREMILTYTDFDLSFRIPPTIFPDLVSLLAHNNHQAYHSHHYQASSRISMAPKSSPTLNIPVGNSPITPDSPPPREDEQLTGNFVQDIKTGFSVSHLNTSRPMHSIQLPPPRADGGGSSA